MGRLYEPRAPAYSSHLKVKVYQNELTRAFMEVFVTTCCAAGFKTFFVVQNAALLWYVGPKQSVPIACKAVFACSLARGLQVLASNGQVRCLQFLLLPPSGFLLEPTTWTPQLLTYKLSCIMHHMPCCVMLCSSDIRMVLLGPDAVITIVCSYDSIGHCRAAEGG